MIWSLKYLIACALEVSFPICKFAYRLYPGRIPRFTRYYAQVWCTMQRSTAERISSFNPLQFSAILYLYTFCIQISPVINRSCWVQPVCGSAKTSSFSHDKSCITHWLLAFLTPIVHCVIMSVLQLIGSSSHSSSSRAWNSQRKNHGMGHFQSAILCWRGNIRVSPNASFHCFLNEQRYSSTQIPAHMGVRSAEQTETRCVNCTQSIQSIDNIFLSTTSECTIA
jgi:hypothetical protein